jgi:hypothetical protein
MNFGGGFEGGLIGLARQVQLGDGGGHVHGGGSGDVLAEIGQLGLLPRLHNLDLRLDGGLVADGTHDGVVGIRQRGVAVAWAVVASPACRLLRSVTNWFMKVAKVGVGGGVGGGLDRGTVTQRHASRSLVEPE